MKYTAQEIVSIIDRVIEKCSGKFYSDYYIGITDNIEERLFGAHNFDREKDCGTYCQAINIEHARVVEKYFLEKGMKGGDGGGNNNSTYVYCYFITNTTQQ